MNRMMLGILVVLVAGANGLGAEKRAVLADRALVQYLAGNDAVELEPLREVAAGEHLDDFTTLPLMLTEPRTVKMEGHVYRIEQDGLYRFFDLLNRRRQYDRSDKRQVILYRGDVWRFAGHLTRLHVHGHRHNTLSDARCDEMARLGERVSITCGNTSGFVRRHLSAVGVKTRNVASNTMEPKLGDNGHVLCEIYDPREKRWILYDSDGGCRFRYGGRLLDLGKTSNLYRSGKTPDLDFISWSRIDTFDHDSRHESVTRAHWFTGEGLFRNQETLHAWYGRILQVPMIDGDSAVASDEEAKEFQAFYGKSRKCIPWAEWRERHYGSPSSLPAPEPRHLREMDAVKRGHLVQYHADNSAVYLQPAAAPEGTTVRSVEDLPLVLTEPVWAEWDGQVYRIEKEGLFRFASGVSVRKCAQVVLHRGDPWRLAGHLSRLHVYGWWHDGVSHDELADLARKGDRPSLSSFHISRFVQTNLEKQGIQARVCGTVTLDEWHDYWRYDNLRTLCEIFDPAEKRWILFDAEVGCRFRDNGNFLDLGEVCDLYRSGERAELDFVSWPAVVDTRARYGNRYTFYTYIMESVFHSEPALQNWYRRMFQVPFQQPNNRDRYFGIRLDEEFDQMVLLLRDFCHRVDWQQWREKYY